MDREALLSLLVRMIVSRKTEDRPLTVAIDGRCAAGKSVLADELGALISARGFQILRPSMDGFHHPQERRYRQSEYSAQGYYEDAFNYEQVVENLLKPLSGSAFPVLCREACFDYRLDVPLDAPPLSANARTILLFEGLFLFRRELNPYWDLRVLVDVDPETSISRALVRDTTSPTAIVRRKYEDRYEPAWQIYLNAEHPESKADVIVDNRDFSRPLMLKLIGCT
jgi:uridine kinase